MIKSNDFMSYIARDIESSILSNLNEKKSNKNIMILSGPRQVGKTACIRHILQTAGFKATEINFENKPSAIHKIEICKDFSVFSDLMKEEYGFTPSPKTALFFDESQHCKSLVRFIRFMKETWQNANVIISGSNISEILDANERYPVGRVTHYSMNGFSFQEFLRAKSQNSLIKFMHQYKIGNSIPESYHERFLENFHEYLLVGGLPEVALAFIQKQDWYSVLENLIQSYRLDFTRYFGSEKENLFTKAFQAVAANVGSPSKDSQVMATNRPAYRFVPDIYSRLEKWEMIIKSDQVGLQPEKTNFYPKRYLFDPAILQYFRLGTKPNLKLTDRSSPELRKPLGGVLENYLALALHLQTKNIQGLKLAKNVEVDFLYSKNHKTIPLECKAALKSKHTHIRSLKDACESMKLKQGILFNLAHPQEYNFDSYTIYTLPLYLAETCLS